MEYEEKQTKEAKLANDLDQIDMYMQSLAYEKKYSNQDLEEFRTSAKTRLITTLAKNIIENIK